MFQMDQEVRLGVFEGGPSTVWLFSKLCKARGRHSGTMRLSEMMRSTLSLAILQLKESPKRLLSYCKEINSTVGRVAQWIEVFRLPHLNKGCEVIGERFSCNYYCLISL